MKRAAHVIVTPELAKKSESRSCGSRVVAEVHRAEPQDCELVVLLRARDERGFDLAYARYGQRIFGFLLRLTRSRGLAEDLFQHTFLRLAEHGASLRPDSDLKAWLFAVARNAFHSHARAQALAARLDPRAQYELRSLLPDWRLEASELEVALGRLAAGDREILLLIGVEDLEHAEAAAVLGIELGVLRKRLSRARVRLADALDEIMPKSERR